MKISQSAFNSFNSNTDHKFENEVRSLFNRERWREGLKSESEWISRRSFYAHEIFEIPRNSTNEHSGGFSLEGL